MIKNTAWNLAAWAAIVALGYVATPIQVHALGPSDFGLLALLLSVIAPLGLFDFGVGEATVKHMAESLGQGDRVQAQRFLRSTVAFNLLVGVLGALILWALASTLVIKVFSVDAARQSAAVRCLYSLGISWACTQISGSFIGALTAVQDYRRLSVLSLAIQGSTLTAGAAAAAYTRALDKVVFAQTAATLVGTFMWYFVARRRLPDFVWFPAWHGPSLRATTGMGVWQMVNKLGGLAAQRGQFWLMGISLTSAAIGHYSVAYQLAVAVYLVTYRVGQVVFPRVSELQGQGRPDEAARLTLTTTWLCSIIGLSVLAATATFARDVLTLWVGSDIAASVTPVLRILLWHVAVSLIFAIPNFYLLGTGRASWIAYVAISQGLIVLAAAWWLAPTLGVRGVAWAVVLGSAAQAACLILLWHKILYRWIGGWDYFGSLLLPLMVAIAVVILSTSIRDRFLRTLGIAPLLFAGAGTAGLLAVLILTSSLFVPGGRSRWTWFWVSTCSKLRIYRQS